MCVVITQVAASVKACRRSRLMRLHMRRGEERWWSDTNWGRLEEEEEILSQSHFVDANRTRTGLGSNRTSTLIEEQLTVEAMALLLQV